jgi:hypothetical protein
MDGNFGNLGDFPHLAATAVVHFRLTRPAYVQIPIVIWHLIIKQSAEILISDRNVL